MDHIKIRDAYKKSNLLGWMGLEWEANDCVKMENQICQFDFKKKVVKILDDFTDEEPTIIAQIQSFVRPSIKPFVGILRGNDFQIFSEKKFVGLELKFVLGTNNMYITSLGLESNYVIDGMVDMRFDSSKEVVEVKVLPEYRNLGIIAGAILLKYGLYYLKTDTR